MCYTMGFLRADTHKAVYESNLNWARCECVQRDLTDFIKCPSQTSRNYFGAELEILLSHRLLSATCECTALIVKKPT